jgi:putative ABC transport system permease protein
MRFIELLRLVWLNLTQNKFKVIMTSVGVIVGSLTIFLVIAIGEGGQEDVREQFKNLNAGAIDITYEGSGTFGNTKGSGGNAGGGGMSSMGGNAGGGGMPSMGGNAGGGGMPSMGGNAGGGGMPSMGGNAGGGGMPSMGGAMGGGMDFGSMMGSLFGMGSSTDRVNQEAVTLNTDDVEELETFVSGISAATISYSTKTSVDGGDLDEATTYTVAGVLQNYAQMSNISLSVGDFITDSDEENKSKICVLGASVAKEMFGSALDAYDETIYIDDRPYVVNGVLEAVGTVSSGISPDEAVFIPYATMEKYLTGSDINPTITIIAEDVDDIDNVIADAQDVLALTYPNTEFTYTDAGSKMEAATQTNSILTVMLYAMAAIVFVVGGIGIMNVLSLSVKERTREIGVLKSIGCSKADILLEFLLEACLISIFGGVLGVGIGVLVEPLVEYFNVSVILTAEGGLIAVAFATLTGTVFGFYPALQASRLIPIEALSSE